MSVEAFGTLLEYGDTADYTTSVTWTAVAKVREMKLPKLVAKEMKTTHLTSANNVDTFYAGTADPGEIEATLEYDKTLAGTLSGLFRTTKAWRVHYPDDSGIKCNGFIKAIGDELKMGDIVLQSVTIQVSGLPVWDSTILS